MYIMDVKDGKYWSVFGCVRFRGCVQMQIYAYVRACSRSDIWQVPAEMKFFISLSRYYSENKSIAMWREKERKILRGMSPCCSKHKSMLDLFRELIE